MAVTKGSNTTLVLNEGKTITPTSFTAEDGITFPFDGDCQRMVLILKNSSTAASCSFTIKGGNGFQGDSDITITVAASGEAAITVESGGYEDMSGSNAGKLLVTASGGTPQAAMLKLPQYNI